MALSNVHAQKQRLALVRFRATVDLHNVFSVAQSLSQHLPIA
jgi:hypothetical protein